MKKDKKDLTVTIGIPAHNEEANPHDAQFLAKLIRHVRRDSSVGFLHSSTEPVRSNSFMGNILALHFTTYFRCPQNKKDFESSYRKILSGKQPLYKHFPKAFVDARYRIPPSFLFRFMLSYFISSPVAFMSYLFLSFPVRLSREKVAYSDFSNVSSSTKLVKGTSL